MIWTAATAAGVVAVLSLSGTSVGQVEPSCDLSGTLTNVGFRSIGISPSCVGSPGSARLTQRTWLIPPAGADRYDGALDSTIGWNITSSATLPLGLVCRQSVSVFGQEIAGASAVPMSDPPPSVSAQPPHVMTYGTGMATPESVSAIRSVARTGSAEVSLDCGDVGSAKWTIPTRVLVASPADRESGVSINDGAEFTNNAEVSLDLGWKGMWAVDQVKVSNDGGFAASRTTIIDLTTDATIPWKLVVLGSERLPKTVYVRFHHALDGQWEQSGYSDDIVLDTVVPQIVMASLSGASSASVSGAGRLLRVKAKDNKSGLASIQVSAGKPKKRAKIMKFRKAVPAPKSGRVFVRVRDGAGNWSKWRSAQ